LLRRSKKRFFPMRKRCSSRRKNWQDSEVAKDWPLYPSVFNDDLSQA
jgi:hypothetical protein